MIRPLSPILNKISQYSVCFLRSICMILVEKYFEITCNGYASYSNELAQLEDDILDYVNAHCGYTEKDSSPLHLLIGLHHKLKPNNVPLLNIEEIQFELPMPFICRISQALHIEFSPAFRSDYRLIKESDTIICAQLKSIFYKLPNVTSYSLIDHPTERNTFIVNCTCAEEGIPASITINLPNNSLVTLATQISKAIIVPWNTTADVRKLQNYLF